MDLVDLITPSLAAFAALVAIGLGLQAFRQGRRIRRLEGRLSEMGEGGTAAPLERLAQLQQRMQTSSGEGGMSADTRRRLLTGVATVLGVAVVAAGAWFLWQRMGDDDGSAGATPTTAATTPATTSGGTTTAARPADGVCTGTQPVDDPAAVTVTVFNASGVTGAALNKIWPMLQSAGYGQGQITNPPDGASGLARSSVQFVAPGDRAAACAVAKELGLNRAIRLDGYTPDQVGGENVNVVVVVGLDLANR